jgi:ankyrin repeat protein
MSLKENLDVFQGKINHDEISIACNLGFAKVGSNAPDTEKCIDIIRKNFASNNPNIYLKNKKGEDSAWTPLMMCVFKEYYDGVDFLLEIGADPNMVGKDGKSALSIAAIKNKPSIIKRLLKAKAEINYSDLNGRTALMNACECGSFDNVKTLLENKADIKIKNKKNQTCIDVGIEKKEYDIIKYLEHFYFDSVLKPKNTPEKAKTKI